MEVNEFSGLLRDIQDIMQDPRLTLDMDMYPLKAERAKADMVAATVKTLQKGLKRREREEDEAARGAADTASAAAAHSALREQEQEVRELHQAMAALQHNVEDAVQGNDMVEAEPAALEQVLFEQVPPTIDIQPLLQSPVLSDVICELLQLTEEFEPIADVLDIALPYLKQRRAAFADPRAQETLFNIVAYSRNANSAEDAFEMLHSMITGNRDQYPGVLEASIPSTARNASPAKLTWLPTPQWFLEVFQKCGYKCQGSGRPRRNVPGTKMHNGETSTSADASAPAHREGSRPWYLPNLRLVLRILQSLAQQHCHRTLQLDLRAAPTKQLLKALIHLWLDPAVRFDAGAFVDLPLAATALTEAIDEDMWPSICSDTALTITQLGPSFRSPLQFIGHFPAHSSRISLLQQHTAATLLKKLYTGKMPSSSTRSRNVRPVPASEVRDVLSGDLKTLVMALCGGKKRKVDCWHLMSIVDCAHAVLWFHVDNGTGTKLSEDIFEWWLNFLRTLDKQLRGNVKVYPVRVRLSSLENKYRFTANMSFVKREMAP